LYHRRRCIIIAAAFFYLTFNRDKAMKHSVKILSMGLIAVTMLGGCATAPPIPADAISKFEKGVTTQSEMIQVLGKPSSINRNSDGTTVIMWLRSKTQIKSATYVPIVGLFAGGATAENRTFTATFDADGLLTESSDSAMSIDCNALGSCQ